MRLVCPNCEAQYEVPDDVIPQEGRDVQCSNCGDTWFQPFAGLDLAGGQEAEVSDDDEFYEDIDEPDSDFETAQFFEDDATFEDDLADEIGVGSDEGGPDDDAADEARDDRGTPDDATDAPRIPRRELEPSVAQVLREEAEREARARAAEASTGLESQPDLGLDTPFDDISHGDQAAARSPEKTQSRDDDDLSAAVADAIAISRRDLLPDVEEINSSLRSSSDRPEGEAALDGDAGHDLAHLKRRSGFRSGFSLTLLLAVILFALYVMTPKIIAAVPEAQPYLAVYVETVDTGRVWLDGQMRALMRWIEAKSAS